MLTPHKMLHPRDFHLDLMDKFDCLLSDYFHCC
uniref:Uncharacterized protein n=1 Tax=Arundo donax TaxID=35708 RepID=A0A0A9GH10_ARUDO